jgi:hypothetical protein
LEGVVSEIVKAYDDRNRPVFVWDDGATDAVILPAELADDEEE